MMTQVRARLMTSTTILVLALLAASWSYAPRLERGSAQASPLSITGMVVQTDESRLWAWDANQVLVQVSGSDRLAEVQSPENTSLTNVRAVVEASQAMWIMNPEHVYQHIPGTLEVAQVVSSDGLPITNAKGVIGAVSCPNNFGGLAGGDSVLVWTANRLLLGKGNAFTTVELLSGTASVSGVLGVVPTCPEGAWIWTASVLLRWEKGSRQLIEVKATGGSSIARVNSVVIDPDHNTWIVTATKVLEWFRDTSSAAEIVDTNGFGLAGTNVLVGHLAASTFSASGVVNEVAVWLATNDHVYRSFAGTNTVAEVFSPAGAPLTGVRGIVAAGSPSEQSVASRPGEVVLWNAVGVFEDMPGTNRTRQIATPTGTSIPGVRGGIAFSLGASTEILFWNDAGLFRHASGNATANEVLSGDGAALPGIRGVIPAMREHGGYDVWIWSAAEIYLLGAGIPSAARVQGPVGMSVSQAWAIVASGESAWIWTPSSLYTIGPGSTRAHELHTNAGSTIPSPADGLLALVTHPQLANHLEMGPWGASLVNPPVPRPVMLAGSLRGGVDIGSVSSNNGLTTLTAFTGAVPYIQDADSDTLLVGPAAVLFSSAANLEPAYRLYLPVILKAP